MGTSSSFSGNRGQNPLIPSWVDSELPLQTPQASASGQTINFDQQSSVVSSVATPVDAVTGSSAISSTLRPDRYTSARSNFTKYVKRNNLSSFRKAVRSFSNNTYGGTSGAARRMGVSVRVASNLISILSTPEAREKAWHKLQLSSLEGQSTVQIFASLVDFVCNDDGGLDTGLARDAYIETIADLVTDDVNFESVDSAFLSEILVGFVERTIINRILIDIGGQFDTVALTTERAALIVTDIRDFVHGAVYDRLVPKIQEAQLMSGVELQIAMQNIYQVAFEILSEEVVQ